MNRFLFLTQHEKDCFCRLEDGVLVDYQIFDPRRPDRTGTVYNGTIVKMLPSLDAAQVDIGLSEPVFLPLSVSEKELVKNGQEVLVQVIRMPEQNKHLTVSLKLSFPGRYVVLTPADPRVSVSAKITSSSRREELKKLGERFPGAGQTAGYILRTESQKAPDTALEQEAQTLYRLYQEIVLKARYSLNGTVLYHGEDSLGSQLLDWPMEEGDEIVCENAQMAERINVFCRLHALAGEISRIKVFEQKGRFGMDEVYKISSQLSDACRQQYRMPGGSYLLFEPGQTLCAIDVNSGQNLSGQNKEETVSRINQQAVPYIVSQIRLRNISGMILIDFINMKKAENRELVMGLLKKEFAKDNRKVQVMGFTRLQLCEISRQKIGLSLADKMPEDKTQDQRM